VFSNSVSARVQEVQQEQRKTNATEVAVMQRRRQQMKKNSIRYDELYGLETAMYRITNKKIQLSSVTNLAVMYINEV